MDLNQIYYLQKLGYTVWLDRFKPAESACDCLIQSHKLDQAPLICCFTQEPNKLDKDLWVFIAMAFDLEPRFYILSEVPTEAHHICWPCVNAWLKQARHHHMLYFGKQSLLMKDISLNEQCLILPELSEIQKAPLLKKECFSNIHTFMHQYHIAS